MYKIRYDWKMIEIMCEDLSNMITQSETRYKYVYGLPRGGLIPAVLISHILDIELVTNIYNFSQHKLSETIVVDDIIDSGNTIETFIKNISPQYSTRSIDVASLFWRKDVSSFKPKFYAATVDNKDVWILFPWESNGQDSVSKVICKT